MYNEHSDHYFRRFTILSAHCSLRFILLCLSRILCVLTEHINIVVSFFICMIIDRIVHPIDDQSALWNVVIIVLPVFRLFAVFHYKNSESLRDVFRIYAREPDSPSAGHKVYVPLSFNVSICIQPSLLRVYTNG